jgi:hypothetical protein
VIETLISARIVEKVFGSKILALSIDPVVTGTCVNLIPFTRRGISYDRSFANHIDLVCLARTYHIAPFQVSGMTDVQYVAIYLSDRRACFTASQYGIHPVQVLNAALSHILICDLTIYPNLLEQLIVFEYLSLRIEFSIC